jgi:hypothetical protein
VGVQASKASDMRGMLIGICSRRKSFRLQGNTPSRGGQQKIATSQKINSAHGRSLVRYAQ